MSVALFFPASKTDTYTLSDDVPGGRILAVCQDISTVSNELNEDACS